MAYPEDGLASFIAAPTGGWEPQRQGMGVVQIALPAAVTSANMNTLMLGVKTAQLPARAIGKESIKYLAGYSNVATKPDEPAPFTATFHDYVDIGIHQALHDWSQLVWDQRSGWLGFASSYKGNALFLQFGPAPVGGSPSFIRAWEMVGIFPLTQIASRTIDYENNTPVTLEYEFAVDDYIYLGIQ